MINPAKDTGMVPPLVAHDGQVQRAFETGSFHLTPLQILHVEDDPDDAFFFERAIKNAKLECELHLEINGEKAVEYLSKAGIEGHSSSHPIPHLMVLDLKLPGLSGFEVLSWARGQKALKTLPIVVLSGSSLKEDKSTASALGASDFIVKQSDFDQIVEQVVQFISKNGLARASARRESNVPKQPQLQ